jgi:RNA polymerase sigma factor (sigma-70 family)
MFKKTTGQLFSLFSSNHRPYASTEQLVEALRVAETAAIEYLMEKTESQVRRLARKWAMGEQIIQDVLHDGLVILIEKIRSGNFDAEKSTPATYLTAICRNLLANQHRLKRQPSHNSIEYDDLLADFSFIELLESKDRCETLEKLLSQLGEPAADLIRLKYIEGYNDETQILEQMTPYSTVESLRVMRSRGMKTLVGLAEKWKSSNDAI